MYRGSQGSRYDGEASDVFSLGCCLFVCLFKRHPVQKPKDNPMRRTTTIFSNITSENLLPYIDKISRGRDVSPACKDLLMRMLEIDPDRRIRLADVLRHEFLTQQ